MLKKQLEQTKKKLKSQEVQEVKQSKLAPPVDEATNYGSTQPPKSPRGVAPQKQLTTLNDLRKDRKIKKLGVGNAAIGVLP